MVPKRSIAVRLYAFTFGPAGGVIAFSLVLLGIALCKWQLAVVGLLAMRTHDRVSTDRKTTP